MEELANLSFVDTETTSLSVETGIWEVGLITREYNIDAGGVDEHEYVWQLPVDLRNADPLSLRINRFHDRRWPNVHLSEDIDLALQGAGEHVVPPDAMHMWAARFVDLTRGTHLVGTVPSFDDERLRRLLFNYNQIPMWHYHLVDVEALAAGKLKLQPPWNSEAISVRLGVMIDPETRHTAIGDCRWTRNMYDAVFFGTTQTAIVEASPHEPGDSVSMYEPARAVPDEFIPEVPIQPYPQLYDDGVQ